MTATVATVTSGKGGAGKTITTANLAVAFALGGQKVVCIDGDIGLRNLDVVLGLDNRIMTQEGREQRLVADIPVKVTRRRRSG